MSNPTTHLNRQPRRNKQELGSSSLADMPSKYKPSGSSQYMSVLSHSEKFLHLTNCITNARILLRSWARVQPPPLFHNTFFSSFLAQLHFLRNSRRVDASQSQHNHNIFPPSESTAAGSHPRLGRHHLWHRARFFCQRTWPGTASSQTSSLSWRLGRSLSKRRVSRRGADLSLVRMRQEWEIAWYVPPPGNSGRGVLTRNMITLDDNY